MSTTPLHCSNHTIILKIPSATNCKHVIPHFFFSLLFPSLSLFLFNIDFSASNFSIQICCDASYFDFFLLILVSNPSTTPQDEHCVHPSIDRRVCVKAGVKPRKTPIITATATTTTTATTAAAPSSTMSPTATSTISSSSTDSQSMSINNTSRSFPKLFGNKNLESILARLDDPHINLQLVEHMDESNPNIVLEYLLESNKYTQITTNLSDDDIYIIFKYFNDFLLNNYQGNFQKLRELKLYKPIWGSLSNDDKQQSLPIQQCCSLENLAHVYVLNEDWSNLIRRSFKRNFFSEQFHEKKLVFIMQKKIDSLKQIFSHLRFHILSDVDIFIQLCLPNFRKLDVKSQVNLLKSFLEDIDEKLSFNEKDQTRKHLHDQLEIFTQHSRSEINAVVELYDPNIKNIHSILDNHHFPDEQFHSLPMIKFLKECGLRSYISTEKCKQIMESIQSNVKQQGWTNEQRKRSKYLYEHLIQNWTRYDNSILDYKFLEPYQMTTEHDSLLKLHEQYVHTTDTNSTNDFFRFNCIKLTDGELLTHARLCWTSTYLLPDFVKLEYFNEINEQQETIDENALEFFKLNKKPSYALVQKNLSNLAKKFSLKYHKLKFVFLVSIHTKFDFVLFFLLAIQKLHRLHYLNN